MIPDGAGSPSLASYATGQAELRRQASPVLQLCRGFPALQEELEEVTVCAMQGCCPSPCSCLLEGNTPRLSGSGVLGGMSPDHALQAVT